MLILRAAACGGRKAASSDDKIPIRQQLIKGFCPLRLNGLFRERKILHLGYGFSFLIRSILRDYSSFHIKYGDYW